MCTFVSRTMHVADASGSSKRGDADRDGGGDGRADASAPTTMSAVRGGATEDVE
jgi:hypothetical protein